MADETPTNNDPHDETGNELVEVPYMSQAFDDLQTSLTDAIAARKALMEPLIEKMTGDDVTQVISWLEEHHETYRDEYLVSVHYDAALGCLKRLRDAAQS